MVRWGFLGVVGLFGIAAPPPPLADDAPVSYEREIAPLLEERCLACHEDGSESSGLRLDSVGWMLKGGRKGPAVAPGHGADSLLVRYIKGQEEPQMPPDGELSPEQIALIERWIDQGAKAEAEDGR